MSYAAADRVFIPTSRRACERFPRHSPYARAKWLRHLRNLSKLDAPTVLRRTRRAVHIDEPPVYPNEQVEGPGDDRVIAFVAENLDVGYGLAEGWFEFVVVCLALIYDILFGPVL